MHMPETPVSQSKRPDPKHHEGSPASGFIGRAAKAVEIYCLLPRPSPLKYSGIFAYLKSFSYPRNYLSDEDCIERHIRAEAAEFGIQKYPKKGEADYAHILRHANSFAAKDAAMCRVRNFEDVSEVPEPYFGYRGADNQCHATTDKKAAQAARCAYDQFEKPANERLFLPRAPRRANAKGECIP